MATKRLAPLWWAGGNLNRLNSFFVTVEETHASLKRAFLYYDSLTERLASTKPAIKNLCDAVGQVLFAWQDRKPHTADCQCSLCVAMERLDQTWRALDSIFDTKPEEENSDATE